MNRDENDIFKKNGSSIVDSSIEISKIRKKLGSDSPIYGVGPN